MPKVEYAAIEETSTSGYPPPFDQQVAGRWARRLAAPTGLTMCGANIVRLEPGAWSSQRHWHDGEDELLVMMSGTAVLVEDGGETVLATGDVAVFPKGTGDGHHLINRSDEDCRFLVVGAGPCTGGGYSDIDMMFTADGRYVRKDGSAY